MIKVGLSQYGGTDSFISADSEEELRNDFRALFGAIGSRIDIILIFFEEFNKFSHTMEEQLKNGKNDSSN